MLYVQAAMLSRVARVHVSTYTRARAYNAHILELYCPAASLQIDNNNNNNNEVTTMYERAIFQAQRDTREHIQMVMETVAYTRIADMLALIERRHNDAMRDAPKHSYERAYHLASRNFIHSEAQKFS